MKRIPKWLRILLFIGFLFALMGGIAGYLIAKHPKSAVTKTIVLPVVKPLVDFVSGFTKHANVDRSEPQFILSPDELQAAFGKNEAEAKTLYEGKIVQVSGTISSIESPTDTNIVILLAIENDPVSNVSCQMDAAFNTRINGLAAGNNVAIKGICNGVHKDDLLGSLDVLLNRCVAVK